MTLTTLEKKKRQSRVAQTSLQSKTVGQQEAEISASTQRRVPAWGIIFWILVMHVGLLAAPFTFTWQALALTVVLHWLTGGVGICLGYHRLFTHASFTTYAPVRWLLALVGGLAGEGSALDWVANHRKHHALSDQPGDPHSPHDGGLWSHMVWLFWSPPHDEHMVHLNKWVPDLQKDRVLVWIGQQFLWIHIISGIAITALGYALGGIPMAASFLVWGVFARLVFVLHSTWFVNSASHMWGYRNYETTDDSRNNWWVAILTYGEGWHNNHHAYPRMALHGHKWWEIDLTYTTIRLMRACGLAWNVVDYKHRNEQAA